MRRTNNSRFTLSRRTMLRGTAYGSTVALALPLLEAMLNTHGDALAGGQALPRRLVTWGWGSGCAAKYPQTYLQDKFHAKRFEPDGVGQNYELTPQLAPFANVREYVSILSGFKVGAAEGGGGHHRGCTGFSGHPIILIPPLEGEHHSKPSGPTIDQVAAAAIGDQTFLPSLQIGISKEVIDSEGPTIQFFSHKGKDQPLPNIYEPQEAWNKLFKSFTVPDDPTRPHRIASLDAIKNDLARLEQRVGHNDKIRLEAHLSSIEQLRGQIDAMAPLCGIPPQPTVANEGGEEPLEEVNKAMADLVALAFECDVTRLVSFCFTSYVSYARFWQVGTNRGYHDITHDDEAQGFVETNEIVDKALIFIMQQLAYLLERLKDTPDGASNLLDNSIVYATSELGVGRDHNVRDLPMLLAGRGGGALVHPGIHYRSESNENNSDVLLAILQSLVPQATEIGGGGGHSTTPCAGILA